MDKLSLLLQTLDCSYGIEHVCYDNNIVSFTVYALPEDLYKHILAKFGLQDDIVEKWCHHDARIVVYVNINRLLVDEQFEGFLSA